MGASAADAMSRINPTDPLWDYIEATSPDDCITFAELMELIEEYRNVKPDEEDLSGCVHVINENRMTELNGYTILVPVLKKTISVPMAIKVV